MKNIKQIIKNIRSKIIDIYFEYTNYSVNYKNVHLLFEMDPDKAISIITKRAYIRNKKLSDCLGIIGYIMKPSNVHPKFQIFFLEKSLELDQGEFIRKTLNVSDEVWKTIANTPRLLYYHYEENYFIDDFVTEENIKKLLILHPHAISYPEFSTDENQLMLVKKDLYNLLYIKTEFGKKTANYILDYVMNNTIEEKFTGYQILILLNGLMNSANISDEHKMYIKLKYGDVL